MITESIFWTLASDPPKHERTVLVKFASGYVTTGCYGGMRASDPPTWGRDFNADREFVDPVEWWAEMPTGRGWLAGAYIPRPVFILWLSRWAVAFGKVKLPPAP